jgi:integrase
MKQPKQKSRDDEDEKESPQEEENESIKDGLLQDPNVKRWFDNKLKSSPVAADVDLRRLGRFCRAVRLTPAQFAKLPVVKMENVTMDYINELETSKNPKTGKKYAPTYIASNLKVIKSWAYWNRKRFERKINVSNPNRRPTLEEERIPTPQELARVLYADSTPIRTRISIAVMAFSGARPEVQGDYLGVEGLRIKDFPEMKISEGGIVEFAKVPTVVIVREELSKSRHQYITFLGEEGCSILKDYLERRINMEGEKIVPSSAIIGTTLSQAKQHRNFGKEVEDASPFLRTTKIGNNIRESMRAAGLPWRPYVFRSYFDTNLMLSESKGVVSHAYQQFWMGHSGDIEAVYTTNKKQLPSDILEDMRSAYSKCCEYLETQKKGPTQDEMDEKVKRYLLSFNGFTDQQIDELGPLSKYSLQELREISDKKRFGTNGKGGQKVIPAEQVKEYIVQGWEYVPNDFLEKRNEAIVRLPM